MQPRLIRLRDIPAYVGMDRNRFNKEFRHKLTEVPIGTQGIAFDRYEIDRLIDDFIELHGRPSKQNGDTTWEKEINMNLGSSNEETSGTSTSATSTRQVAEFERALKKATSKKRGTT